LQEEDIYQKFLAKQEKNSLLVQGNCKAVIDQLNGKSIPRKLSTLHAEADAVVRALKGTFEVVEFRHIPRFPGPRIPFAIACAPIYSLSSNGNKLQASWPILALLNHSKI